MKRLVGGDRCERADGFGCRERAADDARAGGDPPPAALPYSPWHGDLRRRSTSCLAIRQFDFSVPPGLQAVLKFPIWQRYCTRRSEMPRIPAASIVPINALASSGRPALMSNDPSGCGTRTTGMTIVGGMNFGADVQGFGMCKKNRPVCGISSKHGVMASRINCSLPQSFFQQPPCTYSQEFD